MKALIVIWELHSASFSRAALLQRLTEYDGYAFLTSSSCVIKTREEADIVRDHLAEVLKDEDKLYVGETSAPAAWIGIRENVSDWLKSEL